jgi:hypothetical protein
VPGKKRNPLTVVLLATPLVLGPLLLAGVYLGYYLGDVWGYSGTVLAIFFSALGLLASMLILVMLIRWLVRADSPVTS